MDRFFAQGDYSHELNEYLVVAQPDRDVNEKIMAEKQSFYHEYHVKSADKTTPHIIVAGFIGSEAMEGTIIRWMQNIFMKYRTFEVTLNNYSGFPPHEIYLRVQDCSAFLELSKDLQVINAYVSSCSCPPMKPISKPHVTIAGRLPEAIYFKALTQYAHKLFHVSFMVNELLLLRKKHQYDACKTINVFGLHPDVNALFN